jgi:hypothetical protein
VTRLDPYRVLGLVLMVLSTAVVVLLAWAVAPFLLAPR